MIKPHGGKLVNRVMDRERAAELLDHVASLPRVVLDEEHLKDAKNIARGVYSPLEGFLCSGDLKSVVDKMRLSGSRHKSGMIWPVPIVLDVKKESANNLKEGSDILLVDETDGPAAILKLEEKYGYDRKWLAKGVFGTDNPEHPGVKHIYEMGDLLLGGTIDLLNNQKEPFYNFNLDPKETRVLFKERGWETVAAFQTRNPPHIAHEYLQRSALEVCDGLFINPVIGKKKKGDFKDEVILAAYEALIKSYYPKDSVVMSILPMQMRYAGPREAVFHAIIRKNFGCTHFIVGRDHAGVGEFYGSYDAQRIFDEIGDIEIRPLKFENSFFCKKCGSVATYKTCGHEDLHRVFPSGTKIREIISKGEEVGEHLMRSEVLEAIKSFENPYIE